MNEYKSDLDLIKEAVARQNFVILDTETTGLHDGEIIEIAIIDHHANTLMNQRIKPFDGVPPQSTAVHGITLDDLKDCPTFDQVVDSIQSHLMNKDVIVYNAIYDRKMLHRSAEHANIDKIDWKTFSNWMCAMNAFSPLYGEWNNYYGNYKWQSLTTAAKHYHISGINAHSALGDCLMTFWVVKAMVDSQD